MRVSELRVGTELLAGRVTVTALKRDGVYCKVELTSGNVVRRYRLHKTQPIAVVLAEVAAAGKASGSFQGTPHKVRASDPRWRGESSDARPRASWDDSPRSARRSGSNSESRTEPAIRTDQRY